MLAQLFVATAWIQSGVALHPSGMADRDVRLNPSDTLGAAAYSYDFGASTTPPAATAGAYQPSNPPTSCGTGGRPISAGGNGVYPLPCVVSYVRKTAPDGSTAYVAHISVSAIEQIAALAVDADGNAYITGYTGSSSFAVTPGALHDGPAFVAKLNTTGSAFVYSARFGGTGGLVSPNGIAVNAAGEAWIGGSTTSLTFPTVKPLQATSKSARCGTFNDYYPCPTGFVAKVDAAGGNLLFATYLGGSATDAVLGIALDSAGAAYVTGMRGSSDFPITAGAYSATGGAFAAKFAPDGSALLYSTGFGSSAGMLANAASSGSTLWPQVEVGMAIATDAEGDAIVVGSTSSGAFPTTRTGRSFITDTFCTGLSDPEAPGGACSMGFVFALKADGSDLVYSTVLGGHGGLGGDVGSRLVSITVDSLGNAYALGTSGATDYPVTPDAVAPCSPLVLDYTRGAGVLTELDGGGNLVYSTYLSTSPGFPLRLPLGKITDGAPRFLPECVVNAANRRPWLQNQGYRGTFVAPGEVLTILGSGLGPVEGVTAQADENGYYGTALAGTRVLFDGTPAPVLYAQYGQVNLVAPMAISGKTTTMVRVEVQGQATPDTTINVWKTVPGFFTKNQVGGGPAIALNQDGTPNSPENPAARGSVISLLMTGQDTDPALRDGQVASAVSGVQIPTFGLGFTRDASPNGYSLTSETGPAMYNGQAPGFINGVQRLDVVVPATAAVGAKVLISAYSNYTWVYVSIK